MIMSYTDRDGAISFTELSISLRAAGFSARDLKDAGLSKCLLCNRRIASFEVGWCSTNEKRLL